jgi:hypothetical protein
MARSRQRGASFSLQFMQFVEGVQCHPAFEYIGVRSRGLFHHGPAQLFGEEIAKRRFS